MSDLPTREEAQTAIDTLLANHVIQPEMVVLLDVVMAYGVGYLRTSEEVNAALGYMERDGILILDTRLQAIADAAALRCEHDGIDAHRVYPTEHSIPTDYICPGTPKLREALDALTKEDADE